MKIVHTAVEESIGIEPRISVGIRTGDVVIPDHAMFRKPSQAVTMFYIDTTTNTVIDTPNFLSAVGLPVDAVDNHFKGNPGIRYKP